MNIYESMNNHFEKQYGDLDSTKKVETKKPLNESKQKLGARKAAMQESVRSRRAMKEARGRTSGRFTVQKALLDAHLDLPSDLSPESQRIAVKKALDVLKKAQAEAETDAEKRQYDRAINILTNRPTPVAFNSLGAWYSGISMAEQMTKKKRVVKECHGGCGRCERDEEEDEDEDFDESVRTPKFRVNRRKVESLKSAPKRHSLRESKKIVSRRTVKEDLGSDVDKYQKWVDYDMKRYHRISDITNKELRKAGLTVVRDDHGDYEVITEACGQKKSPEINEAKKEKDIWEIIYGELTEDGSQYIVPETGKPRINKGAGYAYDNQVGVDRDGNIVVKAATEEELEPAKAIAQRHKDAKEIEDFEIKKDKYDSRYPFHLTIKFKEDETLDEGFSTLDEFIANIKDEAKQLEDLGNQLKGTYYWDVENPEDMTRVTYTFDGMDYDSKKGARAIITRTIWDTTNDRKFSTSHMYFTLKELQGFVARQRKRAEETLKESKLTEKRWNYNVTDSVAKEFHNAVNAEDEDYERVRKAIIAVYDDIHENTDLLDDDDYEDWVTEGVAIVDFDDEDDVNFELDNLYDFCDNVGVWLGF